MEHQDKIWERLQTYRRDLVDLCDEVSNKMLYNRQVRERWHQRTREWKDIWMPEPEKKRKVR